MIGLARPLDRTRAAAAVVLAVLTTLLLTPSPAQAHAVLVSAVPSAGDALDTAPDEVALTFNEPVVTSPTSLRVFDGDGQRIDDGELRAAGSDLAIGLPDDLPEGAYVAAYRVVSADSHPVAGVLTFTVGDVAALDPAAVDAIAGLGAGTIGVAGSLLRGLGYGGTLLAAGAIAFAAFVGHGRRDTAAAARLGRTGALVGLAAVGLHVPVQTAAVTGFGLLEAVTDGDALRDTLTSGFGQSALVRTVALGALAWLWSRASPAWARWAASTAALGSFLLDGHQRSIGPAWLLVPGDAVHLGGAALWAAGIVLLVGALRARRHDDDPVGAARLVARFSRVALWSVLALSLAGVAMSYPLVRGLDPLLSTTYGTMLLVKVALVAVVVAVAAYNRRQLVPLVTARAVPAGGSVDVGPSDTGARTAPGVHAWATLRRTAQVEAGLLVAVLAVTGFLVTTQPAAVAAGLAGPTMVETAFGDDRELLVTVDPSRPGLNTLHVYVLEEGGTPAAEVEDLRLSLTYLDEDIGPFVVEPFVAGPGHWTASIEDLRYAGQWRAEVRAADGRFDVLGTSFDFTVG